MPRTPSERKNRIPQARTTKVSGAPPSGRRNTGKKAKQRVLGAWRNRIVGTGVEDAEQLLANTKNWRIHPKHQQDALSGVLREVGWVQNVIVNKRTGYVVDGHARVALAITQGESVPVVYVDLTDNEEAIILATLDPLAAMAVTDKDLLASMLAGITVTDADLKFMIAELTPEVVAPKSNNAEPKEMCSECGRPRP